MIYLMMGVGSQLNASNKQFSKALAGMMIQTWNCEIIDINMLQVNNKISNALEKKLNGFDDDNICESIDEILQYQQLVKQKMMHNGCENKNEYLNHYGIFRDNVIAAQVYCKGKSIKNKITSFFSSNSDESNIESTSIPNTTGNNQVASANSNFSPQTNNCTNYIVSAPQLNVRNIPQKPSVVVGKVSQNDRVCIYEFSGKWGRTDMGWISGKFLIPEQTYNNISSTVKKGIVYGLNPNGDGFLSIRTKPNGTEIGRLYNGDMLQILEKRGKWYKIKKLSTGEIGWSFGKWISIIH